MAPWDLAFGGIIYFFFFLCHLFLSSMAEFCAEVRDTLSVTFCAQCSLGNMSMEIVA